MDARRLTLLLLAACDAGKPVGPPECVDGPHLWVGTADGDVGAFATVVLPDGTLTDKVSSATPDHVVQVRGDHAFALLRGSADALRVYEPGCYADLPREIPLPERTNAHDVAVAGGLWFVAGWGLDRLLVLDPETEEEVGSVDLSAFDKGYPEPDQFAQAGGGLYVALQALDLGQSPVAAGEGQIVAIDPGSLTVSSAIPIGPNPKLFEHPADPTRLVVLTGRYSLGDVPPDGALVLLDPVTGTSDVVATEVAPGAEDLSIGAFALDLSDYAEVDGIGVVVGVGYADGSATRILCHDWVTGAWTAGPVLESFVIDAVAAEGFVWLAAQAGVVPDALPGLFQLDPRTCTETGGPWLDTALEPYSLAYFVPAPDSSGQP